MVSPIMEKEVLMAIRVHRIKNTWVALNFDTKTNPMNTGRCTKSGYHFINKGYPRFNIINPSKMVINVI